MASTLAKMVLSNMKGVATSGVNLAGVSPLIDQHLLTIDQSQDRRDRQFHPSDLSRNFCPRAWVLYNYHPDGYITKEGAITPQLNRIFGNGHGVHARIQRYLGNVLFGTWERVNRVDPQTDEPVMEERFGFCPGKHWTYAEVALLHRGDRIKGHTDGILRLASTKDVLEIKSMRADQFRWLGKEPHDAHKMQVDIYLHCLEAGRQRELAAIPPDGLDKLRRTVPEMAFLLRPIDGVWVLYENKDDQSLKQFYIPNDAARVEATMNALRPRMAAAVAFETTRELPACCCPEGKRAPLCAKLKAIPLLSA